MSSACSARSKSPSSKGVVDLRSLNGLDQGQQAWMLEIMMFAQNFGIDPAMEHDVMWLVEEAYCAQMPPGWTHHQDEEGRSYFFNVHTEQSAWTHPMDPVFRDLIGYWRSIKAAGGFAVVEDELARLEEGIREDIGNWVELYDWHGERFYFNKATEESRFDDPRAMRYHDLYTRIRIVSMMREKLPLLAKSVHPNDSMPNDSADSQAGLISPGSQAGLISARSQAELMSAGSQAGLISARSQAGLISARSQAGLISASSQAGLIRLEAERQAWAATKIQSLGRAVIAKRHVRELRRQNSEPMFVPGPLKSRLKLKQAAGQDLVLMSAVCHGTIGKCHAAKAERGAGGVCRRCRDRSAAHIQAWAKGRTDRRRVFLMRKHKRHRDRMATKIQRWVRTWDCILALWQRIEARRRNAAATSIQRVARGRQGRAVARDARQERLRLEQMEHAAVRLQTCARGRLGRREAAWRKAEHQLQNPCKLVFEVMPGEEGQPAWEWKLEMLAITDDLHILPGPPHDLFYQTSASYQEELRREAERERAAAAQRAEEERRHRAACRIQARARGNAARLQTAGLAEKAGWLVKGFFDYSATGPSSVQLSVTFFPNPHFDRRRYADADGDEEADAGESSPRAADDGQPEIPAAASSTEEGDLEVAPTGPQSPQHVGASVEGQGQPVEAEQHCQLLVADELLSSARPEQAGQLASPKQRSPAASARSAQPASQRSPAASARSRQQASPNQHSPAASSRAGQPATPSHRSPVASARAGQPATPSHRSPAASARAGQPATPSHRSPAASARAGQPATPSHRSSVASARSGQPASPVHESPAPSVREAASQSTPVEAAGPGELRSEASARSLKASARSRTFSQSGKASSRSESLARPSLEEQATIWCPEFPAAFTSTDTWHDVSFMSHASSKPKLKQSSKVTEYARQKPPGSEALRMLGETQRANSSPALGPKAKFGGGVEILRAAELKKAALKERRRRQQPEKQPKQHRQVDPIIDALSSKLADKQAFLKYASDRDAMRNRRGAAADKRRLSALHPMQVPFNSSPGGVMHRHVHHHVHVGQGEGSLPEQLPSIAPLLPSDGLQRAASAGELRGDALRGRPASGGSGRGHRTASKGGSALLPALVA